MRIFLTGATGYVGSAVLDALVRAGHDVLGLVRTPERAEQVTRRAVEALVGDLAVPASYAGAAEACDAIVHAALDPSRQRADVDRLAVETLVAAAGRRSAAGRATTLVYTSGTWVLGQTAVPADEQAPVEPPPIVAWRPAHEALVLAAGGPATRTVVVRPGVVYGGARGFIGEFLKDAGNGLVRVIGTGENHWPCVYDRDLADLYARVIASPEASGIFHVNDEADERVGDIVDAIARHAKTRPDVRRVPIEEALTKLGPLAEALALDQIVRSPRARALGWTPSVLSVGGNAARLLEEFRTARQAA